MKMDQTECSEMLAYKIQTPGNYPEENIQQDICHLHDRGRAQLVREKMQNKRSATYKVLSIFKFVSPIQISTFLSKIYSHIFTSSKPAL
jgi:hypothetical protein